jgi:hypothetical protein
MSNCCETKATSGKPEEKQKTTKDFLLEKAKNLRTWLMSYKPDDEVKNYINAFDENLLLPTIQVALVPLLKKGGIPSAAKDLAKKLEVPAEELEAFCKKFEAYCKMFVEVYESMKTQ